jgi:hypothetical protein
MFMKHILLATLFVGIAAGLLAQSIVGNGWARYAQPQSYDPKTPPPLALPEAYALALSNLAKTPGATNRFHCISASCVEMSNTNGWTGWTFWFANTNGDRASLWVFFDGAVTSDVRSSELFRK